MPSKNPTSRKVFEQKLDAVNQSVIDLVKSVDRIAIRLLGDPNSQIKGLTHEVQDLRVTLDQGLKASVSALEKLAERVDHLERFKEMHDQRGCGNEDCKERILDVIRFMEEQAKKNERFEETSKQVEKAKIAVFSSWKTLVAIGTVCSAVSGAITWAITKFL